MRKLISILLSLVLISGIFTATASATDDAPSKTIRIGYVPNYGTMVKSDTKGMEGYGYEYFMEIAKYTGWAYEFIPCAWQEGLELLEQGKIDLFGPGNLSGDVKGNYESNRNSFGLTQVLLLADSEANFGYDDIQNFNGKRIAVGNELYKQLLEEYLQENNFSANIVMLKNDGSQDNLFGELYDLRVTSSQYMLPNTKIVAKISQNRNYYYAKKGNTDLIQEMDNAIDKILLNDFTFPIDLYDKYYSYVQYASAVLTIEEQVEIDSVKTLRIGYQTDYTPMMYKDEKGLPTGMMIEYMKILAEKAEVSLEFVPMERGTTYTPEDFDISLSVTEADDLVGFSRMSVPYFRRVLMMMGRNGSDINDHTTKVGITQYRVLNLSYVQESQLSRIITYPSIQDTKNALLSGEIDFMVSTSTVVNTTINELGTKDYRIYAVNDSIPFVLLYSDNCSVLFIDAMNKLIKSVDSDTTEALYTTALANISQKTSLKSFVRDNPFAVVVMITLVITLFASSIIFVFTRKRKQEVKQLNTDSVTGLTSYYRFKIVAKELLDKAQPNEYTLCRLDIDEFKLINEMIGEEHANDILKYISDCISEIVPDCLSTRIMADHFSVLFHADDENILNAFFKALSEKMGNRFNLNIQMHMGVYPIEDPHAPISSMCDRALLALKSVKASAEKRIGCYRVEMYTKIVHEQNLIAEFDKSLANEEFEIYLQPQINYGDGSLIGAEALVRWNHPTKGFISPGEFIPLFEQNENILKLDYFVWEKCCQLLHRWRIESGGEKNLSISANVSRLSATDHRLYEKLISLIEKYDLSTSMLKLEITESAYLQNPITILENINKLKAAGFVLEMDDFGAGQSSLTALKDIPIDVIKLDMGFLAQSIDNERSGNILASIIRMAHWLKTPVIAEGVETKEQADYLKTLGCIYMQGYYFNKPMRIHEFDAIYRDFSAGLLERYEEVDLNGIAEFWELSAQTSLIFNSLVGGAAILEYKKGSFPEIVRANDNFYSEVHISREEYLNFASNHQAHFFSNDSARAYIDTIETAIASNQEEQKDINILRLSDEDRNTWVHLRTKLLAKNGDIYLLYLAVENIDYRKTLEENLRINKEQLELAVAQAGKNVSTFNIKTNQLHISPEIAKINGLPSVLSNIEQSFELVLDIDKPKVSRVIERVRSGEQGVTMLYRILKGGSYVWERASYTTVYDDNGKPDQAVALIEDATQEIKSVVSKIRTDLFVKKTEQCSVEYDVITDTLTLTTHANGEITQIKRNNYTSQIVTDESLVRADYREFVKDKMIEVARSKPATGSFEYIADNWGTGYTWSRLDYTSVGDEDGNVFTVVGFITNIQSQKNNEQLMQRLNRIVPNHVLNNVQGLMEIVFLRLYDASNLQEAINDVLGAMGEYFDLSRVYIFEDNKDHSGCKNTFEWCANGISPEIDNLQDIVYDNDLVSYTSNFNDEGVFFCPDIKELTPQEYEFLAAQGIHSMLQCSFEENGEYAGMVGFDECRAVRHWTQEEVKSLHIASKIVGSYIMKLRKTQDYS